MDCRKKRTLMPIVLVISFFSTSYSSIQQKKILAKMQEFFLLVQLCLLLLLFSNFCLSFCPCHPRFVGHLFHLPDSQSRKPQAFADTLDGPSLLKVPKEFILHVDDFLFEPSWRGTTLMPDFAFFLCLFLG